MAQNKTTETNNSVSDFLNAIADEARRTDAFALSALLEEQTGLPPKMWGASIVGFGSYHYVYDSGREGDSPLVGFSPRAAAFSVYISGDFPQKEALLQQLGKHKMSGGCLHIKKLSDINTDILRQIITLHVAYMRETYPA